MAEPVDWQALGQAFRESGSEHKFATYRLQKWTRSAEFAGWIEQDGLTSLCTEQALVLYAASGGSKRDDFKSNSIAEIRDSLDFLLYDTVKLEGRFQECADDAGAFKLAGAGKDFVSYLLCLSEPRIFAVWNVNSEKALKKLGMDMQTLRRGPIGIGYIDLLEATALVQRPLGMDDFRNVDEFIYWASRSLALPKLSPEIAPGIAAEISAAD